MTLSIIILSYNTKELTIRCIESVMKQYPRQLENSEFETIVVDNGSTDGTVENIRSTKSIKSFQLIENKENYGFAKGNNTGAKHAKGQYLFFLNSDTEVLDEGVTGMIGFLDKHKNIAILGAKLRNEDGTVQPSAGIFYTLLPTIVMLFGGERRGLLRESPAATKSVDWVSGGAMMVRKEAFNKLDGFDEHFFMYIEDMELCFRAKRQGLLTYFYPNVSIVHKKLGSSNRAFAIVQIYKGLLYFYKKHTHYGEYMIVKLILLVKAYIAITVGVVTRNTYLSSTYRRALSASL